jgi:hypothetical protein
MFLTLLLIMCLELNKHDVMLIIKKKRVIDSWATIERNFSIFRVNISSSASVEWQT